MSLYNVDMITRAYKLAEKAHQGQFRRDGITPYFEHPKAVAKNFIDPYYIATALLHDTIEDTQVREEDLVSEQFPSQVIEAILLLTKTPEVGILDYLLKIKENQIARAVKIADIEHNSLTSTKEKLQQYRLYLYVLGYPHE